MTSHATRPFTRVVRDPLEEREWSRRRLAITARVIDAVRGNPELRDRLYARIQEAGLDGAWP